MLSSGLIPLHPFLSTKECNGTYYLLACFYADAPVWLVALKAFRQSVDHYPIPHVFSTVSVEVVKNFIFVQAHL